LSRFLLYFFSVAFSALLLPQMKEPTQTAPIFIDAATHQWLDGYLSWVHHNPKAKSLLDSSTSSAPTLMLNTPYLELFSPSGKSLYRGDDAKKNAVFIRTLEHGIPLSLSPLLSGDKPSIEDYVHIFPALRQYQTSIFSQKKYILFSITWPYKPDCMANNDALHEFESSDMSGGIQVIIVRLQLN